MKLALRCLAVLLVTCWPLISFSAAWGQTTGGSGQAATAEKTGQTVPLDQHNRALVACALAISVAFVTAVSILGAAYAVAHVGSAAIGAASEKPEMLVKSLVFVALGEGLAILGLIIAFLLNGILDRVLS
jgi:V/A-type H+-transporting ATPase subunit K